MSEPLSGVGKADTLARVTVNIGHVAGGTSMNLVPAAGRAGMDIRLPAGVPCAEAEAQLAAVLAGMEGVSLRVLRRYEPSVTPPDAEIVRTVVAAAGEVLGRTPAVNMRVGASDSRLFRMAGIPSVVYGPTPHNMGGAGEYAGVEELQAVGTVHALASLDFLSSA